LIKEHTRGTFVERLANRLPPAARAGAGAWVARTLASRFRVGHPARRFAGLALAPSLSAALLSATRDRMEASARD
jgi:hypothetical protein